MWFPQAEVVVLIAYTITDGRHNVMSGDWVSPGLGDGFDADGALSVYALVRVATADTDRRRGAQPRCGCLSRHDIPRSPFRITTASAATLKVGTVFLADLLDPHDGRLDGKLCTVGLSSSVASVSTLGLLIDC